jgi:hypothetical protein
MKKSLQQGISLYLAIIIMSILLAMALGLSTILVSQIKMIRGMEKSVIAFYAADTGIERVLFALRKENYLPSSAGEEPCGVSFDCPALLEGEATYTIKIIDFTISDSKITSIQINTKGVYKDTQRAIEVNY